MPFRHSPPTRQAFSVGVISESRHLPLNINFTEHLVSAVNDGQTMRTEFKTTRKIEFADTDMAGIVHFTRFFIFMETAEHEFLRSLGTSVVTEWEGNKIGWPRVTASCEYLHPLRFEDEVDIRLWVSNKGSKSLTYQFDFTLDGVDVARGELTTVCCIANPGEKLQAIPIPDFLAAKISI